MQTVDCIFYLRVLICRRRESAMLCPRVRTYSCFSCANHSAGLSKGFPKHINCNVLYALHRPSLHDWLSAATQEEQLQALPAMTGLRRSPSPSSSSGLGWAASAPLSARGCPCIAGI